MYFQRWSEHGRPNEFIYIQYSVISNELTGPRSPARLTDSIAAISQLTSNAIAEPSPRWGPGVNAIILNDSTLTASTTFFQIHGFEPWTWNDAAEFEMQGMPYLIPHFENYERLDLNCIINAVFECMRLKYWMLSGTLCRTTSAGPCNKYRNDLMAGVSPGSPGSLPQENPPGRLD